jgi:hypothetical protein
MFQGRRKKAPVTTWIAALFTLSSIFLFAGTVSAQPQLGNNLPSPRLMTISPLGGKVGTAVEVSWTGSDLEEPQALLFSHPNIKATPIVPPPPKPDPKDPKKTPPPQPVTKFNVTIAADVSPGCYDVRFVNKWGVSNPRVFVVGDRNEVTEKEPNNDVDQAQKIDVGTTINGAVSAPTDVDYTVFAGKKGQRLLITCLCARLDSRLNPEMKLIDARDRQVGYCKPDIQDDAYLDAILPEDGDYYVRLCHFTYTAGNQEYFYRLTVAEAPQIDAVFPPMVEPGKDAQITLHGRNLPGGKPDPAAVVDGRTLERLTVTVKAPNDPLALQRLNYSGLVTPLMAGLDGFEYRLKGEKGISEPALLTYARAPVVIDNGKNDTPETAQPLNLPCEVAGRIEKPRDRDWYSFTAKKGEVYVIDVHSQRLGAPPDMFWRLFSVTEDKDKKVVRNQINEQEDSGENLSFSLFTLSRDPAPFRFVVPADGKYELMLASHLGDSAADVRHVYRLQIAKEQPDFRLIVMPTDQFRPDACVVGQGGNENFHVYVFRQDGFKGEIELTMEGLPTGVTCKPQVVGYNQKQSLLVVSAAPNAPIFTGEVKVKGTALIGGQKVIREARPAAIVWPVQPLQNIPTVTRLSRQVMLAVRDKPPFTLTAGPDAVTVSHGDKATINFKLARHWPDNKAGIQVQPLPPELPPNLSFGAVTLAPGKDDLPLVMNVAANVPPGKYNLVFRGFAPLPFNKDPNAKQKPNVNVVLPSTPVVLTVLPKQVASLTVNNANPGVQLGKQTELVVTVNRQFDYTGPFTVKLVLPPKVEGVIADEVTIPADQNQAKLVLRAVPNAAPGARPNISVIATAVINGNVTLNHETKINVNVVK